MLTLYRRHRKRCSKAGGRFWKRCACPMWVEGTVNASYIRRSLQTASWERAQSLAHEIEIADDPKATPAKTEEPVIIKQAVDEYLADARARDLAESTLSKLDTGADPNKLVKVTDRVADTTLPSGEYGLGHFTTIRSARAREVLRGVAFAPEDQGGW